MSRQGGYCKRKIEKLQTDTRLFHRNASSYACSNYYICSAYFF